MGSLALLTSKFLYICAGNGKDNFKFSGRIIDSDMHDIGRFLNRLLGLPPEIQNRFVVCEQSVMALQLDLI